ncbi:MAG: hypothetical protein QXE06_06980 [Candidatus Bathyarchaeia archaeon]
MAAEKISRKWFFFVFSILVFCWLSTVNASVLTAEPFKISFLNGESFQIQTDSKYIKFTIQNGNLLGNGSLRTTMETGLLQITPVTNGTLVITFPAGIDFEINHEKYISPAKYNFISGKSFTIKWFISLPVWIPVMLGMGLCGLVMMAIAPVYVISKIKSRDWGDAFCWGFLLFIVGLAFMITWLWS